MVTTQTSVLEANKQLARRIPEDVATEGDLDLLDEICAEDVVDHTPFWEVQGREALKEQIGELREAWDDFSATVEDVIAEGDLVAMRVTLRGTHVGEFMGIEATNRSFEMGNMVFTRIEDGLIVERWVQPDMLGLFQQLGVETIPATPAR